MSDADIALLAGLSVSQVAALSHHTNWDGIPVDQMRKFALACGVDFGSRTVMKHLTRYIKNPSFGYLRRSPDWPRYQKLMDLYASEVRRRPTAP